MYVHYMFQLVMEIAILYHPVKGGGGGIQSVTHVMTLRERKSI
jgi:hypothetical protein